MEILLIKYGYVLLFLGVMVEGEAFLLAGALLAHRGILHFPFVVAIAIVANTAVFRATGDDRVPLDWPRCAIGYVSLLIPILCLPSMEMA